MNHLFFRVSRQLLLLAVCAAVLPGCITFTNHGIPADRIPMHLRAPEKGNRVPLNLALLGQRTPRDYTIAAGDVLGVFIRGVIPADSNTQPPLIPSQSNFTNIYYPPAGQSITPSVGLPMEVSSSGAILLPLVGSIDLKGLTLDQASSKLAKLCVDKKVVQDGREYVYLTLIRSKVHRVVVIRDEVEQGTPSFLRKDAPLLNKRGHAQVVDLPFPDNDVLHALTISGGLPGYDAYNEVVILRRDKVANSIQQGIMSSASSQQTISPEVLDHESFATAKCIPLWVSPDCPPSFTQQDIILDDGDIVYIRGRGQEYFYTAGLLAGGVVPMPRDHDIDILEAISLANGSIGGAGGQSGIALNKIGAGPGNIIPPTRATIVRKLPNKQQVTIRVDLNKAMRDAKHRVVIQPHDIVSLHYKPGQVTNNTLLNLFNLNYIIPE